MLCGASGVWATDPLSHPLCGCQTQAELCCAESFAAGSGVGVSQHLLQLGFFL